VIGPVSRVRRKARAPHRIYLHSVLDLWFEKRYAKNCRVKAYLVRYADDFVACFQDERDAKYINCRISGVNVGRTAIRRHAHVDNGIQAGGPDYLKQFDGRARSRKTHRGMGCAPPVASDGAGEPPKVDSTNKNARGTGPGVHSCTTAALVFPIRRVFSRLRRFFGAVLAAQRAG
jgi:hypothetical protein